MYKKIDILGITYKLYYKTREEDERLEHADGYTDDYLKKIVISKKEDFNNRWDQKSIKIYQNKVLRHEIIHAFLYESGLDCNTNKSISWAENEEMVDWFAIQSPKLLKIYKDLDIL